MDSFVRICSASFNGYFDKVSTFSRYWSVLGRTLYHSAHVLRIFAFDGAFSLKAVGGCWSCNYGVRGTMSSFVGLLFDSNQLEYFPLHVLCHLIEFSDSDCLLLGT